MSQKLQQILRRAPVIPVIVIKELEHAVPLAEALFAGGLTVLEVTLRSPVALDAIAAMRKAVPDAVVGVGTITRPEDFAAADAAGAQFGVSPGLTAELADASRAVSWPWLPGVMTPAELMNARGRGFTVCKLFPAEQAGGPGMLRAMHSVFPEIHFCPTGGVQPANVRDYLSLPNVLCVGGSWVAPVRFMEAGDWKGIRELARTAAALPRTFSN
jgi:2-dehydro-3-deoxyphosphogluconate aldolase / (4S)-4-hydroxy-2-oxoglutarate aldolase